MKELRVPPLVKYGPRNRSTVGRHDRITGTERTARIGRGQAGSEHFSNETEMRSSGEENDQRGAHKLEAEPSFPDVFL
jgi:hypothetical protein